MKLVDRAKAAAEQAATKAKEGVEEVQARKDLHTAYGKLGEKTFELLEDGAIEASHELEPLAARIRELKARLEAPPTPG